MTGFRPCPVSSAQVRHRPNRMPEHSRKRRRINAKPPRCGDARICAKGMECVQLAGAVVRCGLSLRTSFARPGSGQEPGGTATVKPHTCHLQANSKPFASWVLGRGSGVLFVFSWYSHGVFMVFSSHSSPRHPSELRPRSADRSRLFPPFGDQLPDGFLTGDGVLEHSQVPIVNADKAAVAE